MKKNLELFITFAKIGAFTFGGGYAMISLIEKEVTESKKYITKKEMSDIITIAESTPGPISVNTSTYVGYKVNKLPGAIFSTLGLILPSFLIILLLYPILKLLQTNIIFQNAFFGIRCAVVALILNAFITMYKSCDKNIFSHFIILMSTLLILLININPIYILLISAFLGIIYSYIIRKEKK